MRQHSSKTSSLPPLNRMQLLLPPLRDDTHLYPEHPDMTKMLYNSFGNGKVKSVTTDLNDIGLFVALILKDARTLDQYVFVWGDELNWDEIKAIAKKYSDDRVTFQHVCEWFLTLLFLTSVCCQTDEAAVKAQLSALREQKDSIMIHYIEYMDSLWVRGDNTVRNAIKKEYGGALDARALYPDFRPKKFEELAREFYTAQKA